MYPFPAPYGEIVRFQKRKRWEESLTKVDSIASKHTAVFLPLLPFPTEVPTSGP